MSQAYPLYGAQILEQNSSKLTYCVPFILAPTAAMALVHWGFNNTSPWVARIRRVVITNPGLQTTPGLVTLSLFTTGAGAAGGSVVVPKSYGAADGDPDASFFPNFVVTVGGTATPSVALADLHLWVPGAAGPASRLEWELSWPLLKAPSVQRNTVNRVMLWHPGSAGAAGLSGFVEFTMEPNP